LLIAWVSRETNDGILEVVEGEGTKVGRDL
jgi:hypothetical protein